ncbi:MAG: hypothetical protein M0P69_14870 [Bacteroidales bacterium]|nr:hypothetical protein [Bacteroidales bacterium]
MEKAKIKKDIFVAVISNGSIQQKADWQNLCEQAAKWIFSEDTLKETPVRKPKK